MPSDMYVRSVGVMGDTDRTEFTFNQPLSDSERLSLLKRNPRVSMMCDWMVAEALKNGFSSGASEDELQRIHFMEKVHRALMFARLHGSSLVVFLNEEKDLRNASGNYTDFEVYHRLANSNGWQIKSVDKNGEPDVFEIFITTEKMTEPIHVEVNAKRCLVVKNPKKEQRWDGTPSVELIEHVALLEELMIRFMGKHALNSVNAFMKVKNVANDAMADSLEEAFEKVPLEMVMLPPNVDVEPTAAEVQGTAQDFQTMDNILKDYMACAMRVSRQSLDGAAEGTLSSAEYNYIASQAAIKQIQEHFTPYIEEILLRLGMPENITWIEVRDDVGKDTSEE